MILCPSRHSMLWAPKYIRVNFLSLLFLVVHERTPQHKAYNRTSRVQFDCGRMGRFFGISFVLLVCLFKLRFLVFAYFRFLFQSDSIFQHRPRCFPTIFVGVVGVHTIVWTWKNDGDIETVLDSSVVPLPRCCLRLDYPKILLFEGIYGTTVPAARTDRCVVVADTSWECDCYRCYFYFY